MGDFNCNLASPQLDINTVLLTNIFDISNLYQLIDSPTRITNTSSTLIDVIFTNCQNNIVSTGVSHVSLSDHSLVYAFCKIYINSLIGNSTISILPGFADIFQHKIGTEETILMTQTLCGTFDLEKNIFPVG